MDLDLLVNLLDLAGTFAFALVGARIAANKGLDYGGIAFIAAVASLAGGTAATIFPYLKNQDNSSYQALGASGAVSAVIFATIIWNPTMTLGIMFFPFPIPAYIFGPIYLAIEYFSMRRGGTGVAHDAHLGGALFGILFVLLLNIEKGKEFLDLFF